MTALLWLSGAIALVEWARGRWAAAGAVLLACIAGTTLPDLDLPLPLDHRSALTHSVLVPAILLLPRFARWRAATAGLAIGMGLHLAADVFPNAMTGYALVKLPLFGAIGRTGSYLWLAANALLCTAGGAVLLATRFPARALVPLALALAAIGVAYLFVTDGGWPALAVYGAFGWLAVRRRKLG